MQMDMFCPESLVVKFSLLMFGHLVEKSVKMPATKRRKNKEKNSWLMDQASFDTFKLPVV